MLSTYEVTYIVVCDDSGLVSHTIKGIKEIMPKQTKEEEEEEDN